MARFADAPTFVLRELEKLVGAPGTLDSALRVARELPEYEVKRSRIEYVDERAARPARNGARKARARK